MSRSSKSAVRNRSGNDRQPSKAVPARSIFVRAAVYLALVAVAFLASYALTNWWLRPERPTEIANQSVGELPGRASPPIETSQPNQSETASDPSLHSTPPSTLPSATPPTGEPPAGMVWIPGGEFTMGADSALAWPEEGPPHRVRVGGFWMDATDVTNAQFKKFVAATGYKTTAEQAPKLDEIMKQVAPGTPPPDPKDLVPGSLVFQPTSGPVSLQQGSAPQWWHWTPGADWRHPEGPESDLKGRADHPVVQVSWDDAVAYAKWAGKRLPTEAEWEFAARGGLAAKDYVWGDQPPDDTHPLANTWQGDFPFRNTQADGFAGTSPVKAFPPNGYGLYDMAGNVWQWCADWYDVDLYRRRSKSGQIVVNPQGSDHSFNPTAPYQTERVQRGGSFLCSDDYCWRYRPSARQGSSPDTGMSHVGFRCVMAPVATQHTSMPTADTTVADKQPEEICPCAEFEGTPNPSDVAHSKP